MNITKRQEQTKEQWCQEQKNRILSKVTEYDVAMAFYPAGRELRLNRPSLSPFRNEKDESFIMGTKYGCITYKDMGAYEYRGDIWRFVQQIEGLQTFTQVIRRIEQRFNITDDNTAIIGNIITWKQPPIEIIQPPHIQVTTRKFTRQELKYWSEYYQDISDLQREDIYAPKEIYRNRKRLQQTEMTFCYWCADIEKWKIYRPLAPKRVKNSPPNAWKWDNSIGSLQYIENLDKMKGPIGIVTKSRKDRALLRKATGINSICSIQAEDPAAMTDEALYQIWSNVDYKVCVMDNDQKGCMMSTWLTDRGYNHVNVPYETEDDKGVPITDFADMAKYHGIESVTKHFKKKWVI